jgi:Ribbon-helix-helix protein, copG family
MVRTQVQLTENQLKALRHASAETGKSIAELIRLGVEQYLAGRNDVSREERIERAIRVGSRFSSGLTDVSVNHDKYLAEAFAQTESARIRKK